MHEPRGWSRATRIASGGSRSVSDGDSCIGWSDNRVLATQERIAAFWRRDPNTYAFEASVLEEQASGDDSRLAATAVKSRRSSKPC